MVGNYGPKDLTQFYAKFKVIAHELISLQIKTKPLKDFTVKSLKLIQISDILIIFISNSKHVISKMSFTLMTS